MSKRAVGLRLVFCFWAALSLGQASADEFRESWPDTWVATDALERQLPTFEEVGPPRPNRTVGIFYFLWLGPHSQQGGPWDIARILQQDPDAMRKSDSPLWGPLHAPHHWGESIFGYYNTDDPYVLRKHAQMLQDAGVNVVIFDVTNQVTYRDNYMALLRVWSELRRQGIKTPQVAFLCPFWEPAKVVKELYRDLYQPGHHPDLWFRWKGKPLILADPRKISGRFLFAKHDHPAALRPGKTLGQSFTATSPFRSVGAQVPTWSKPDAAVTLALKELPSGEVRVSKRFENLADNEWVFLEPGDAGKAGTYLLEMSEPENSAGWWSHSKENIPGGQAFNDGRPVDGSRCLKIAYEDSTESQIHKFFTFRKPQPDYFAGPTGPDMWSWLEVFPQHVFTSSEGIKEQMSVGVAQNAVAGRLGSMSEPEALGRSFHDGKQDAGTSATAWGYNFAEQFERALKEDPEFIFITGWNEWIAGRFAEFCGIKCPVMFVDQFDQEHSRDIEPMRGGHGDSYYYQMVAFIRRYKGMTKPAPPAAAPVTIDVESGWEQWARVETEFRDDAGDTSHRDFPGYANHTRYTNNAGRNDFQLAKVTCDAENVYFYLSTETPVTSPGLWLLIDADSNHQTGWEGYDLIVNRTAGSPGQLAVERNIGGQWKWETAGDARFQLAGTQLQLALPRRLLPSAARRALQFDFKWADNMPENGDIVSWLTGGDAAPNGRFNYRFQGQ